jgi:type I restriction enzyme S subunit
MSNLPCGWAQATIEDLAGPQGLTTDGDWIETKDQDPNGDVRLIQLADIGDGEFRERSERFVTDRTARRLHCTFLNKGDLPIARMPDPLGRACVFPGLDQAAITAVDVFIWRPSPNGPLVKWLMHFVNSKDVRNRIAEQAGGTTRQRVSGGRVKKLVIPVPPLHEQQRIVAKIDSLSAKSRRARDQLDHIPRLVEKYKQAILQTAFAGHSIGLERKAEFATVPFSNVIASTFYGPRIAADAYIEGGVPTLRTTDISDWGQLVMQDPPQVRVTDAEFAKWGLADQDLLITRTGATIGKCTMYRKDIGPALPSAYLIRVRLKLTLVDAKFALFYLLSPEGENQLLAGRTAVAQPNINARAICSLSIPLPTIEVQKKIVRHFEMAFAWIDRLAADAASARKLVDQLDQAILAKAFRGELVPQDPRDEPPMCC